VLYVALRPEGEGWEAGIASGGHPLPLVLRAGGEVHQVGRTGTLLGIVPDPDLGAERVTLGPGDALVLYTDGVIEASPLDDAFGPAAFAVFLERQAGRRAGEIATAVEEQVLALQDGSLRDDVALVVLRVASGT
jgi:sigma-B regulation protein RsbU (phosphoserine phosphatase)